MIRSVFISPQHDKLKNLSEREMRSALQQPDGLLWISLEKPTPEESTAILQDLFQFHPLAIEDAVSEGYQTPKVDDFGSYIFMVLHAIHIQQDYADIETIEVNFFMGSNYLVSISHELDLDPLNSIWKRMERDERMLQNGSDFLAHGILDAMVDGYLPVLDQLDDELEELEDLVLARPQPRQLERLLALKHSLIFLRRVISPQREVMNRLSRDDYPMIDQQSRIYYRDVYDHLVRFQDLIESLRDVVGSALDIYLNSTSLRLNEVMKALTIVSTIFLPLSFIAGVYGMNFINQYPPYEWWFSIFIFWGICFSIVAGMLVFFKRRGWF
jgi:magnesium transporter